MEDIDFCKSTSVIIKDLKDIIIEDKKKRIFQNTEYHEFICIENKDARRVSVSSLLGYIAYKYTHYIRLSLVARIKFVCDS